MSLRVASVFGCLGVAGFTLACSSDATEGTSSSGETTAVSSAGRWKVLMYAATEKPHPDRQDWEFVEQDALVTVRHCDGSNQCSADWTCDPDEFLSGTAQGGHLRFVVDGEDDGVPQHTELDLVVAEQSFRGTITTTDCGSGEPSCTGEVFGCRLSAGVRMDCGDKEDFKSLAQCTCIEDPGCP